jgi:hypothetical protein
VVTSLELWQVTHVLRHCQDVFLATSCLSNADEIRMEFSSQVFFSTAEVVNKIVSKLVALWYGTGTSLRVGPSGVQIPVWSRDVSFLQNVQTGSGTHPAIYTSATGFFPRDDGGRNRLVLRLRISGAVPTVAPYDCIECTGTSSPLHYLYLYLCFYLNCPG